MTTNGEVCSLRLYEIHLLRFICCCLIITYIMSPLAIYALVYLEIEGKFSTNNKL